MIGIDNLLLFIITGFLLNLTPGPDTIYIISRSIAQGKRAGISAVLGISTGCLFHTIAGAFGFSALIMASPGSFFIIKIAGALYLIFQGLLMILNRGRGLNQQDTASPQQHLFLIYRQGTLTNILNPKVALFFIAFLPQFISASSPNKTLSFIILGILFITTATLWCSLVALFSAYFSTSLRTRSRWYQYLNKLNGVVFIGLGIKLAFNKQ